MGGLSIWHWLLFVIVVSLIVWPAWRILKRAGYSGAWSLLMLVPILNIIVMYVFAFARWPVFEDRREHA